MRHLDVVFDNWMHETFKRIKDSKNKMWLSNNLFLKKTIKLTFRLPRNRKYLTRITRVNIVQAEVETKRQCFWQNWNQWDSVKTSSHKHWKNSFILLEKERQKTKPKHNHEITKKKLKTNKLNWSTIKIVRKQIRIDCRRHQNHFQISMCDDNHVDEIKLWFKTKNSCELALVVCTFVCPSAIGARSRAENRRRPETVNT